PSAWAWTCRRAARWSRPEPRASRIAIAAFATRDSSKSSRSSWHVRRFAKARRRSRRKRPGLRAASLASKPRASMIAGLIAGNRIDEAVNRGAKDIQIARSRVVTPRDRNHRQIVEQCELDAAIQRLALANALARDECRAQLRERGSHVRSIG